MGTRFKVAVVDGNVAELCTGVPSSFEHEIPAIARQQLDPSPKGN